MPVETIPITAETDVSLSVEASLAHYMEGLDRLALEANNLAGTNAYPEWWDEYAGPLRETLPRLKQEGTDPAQISKYFELFGKSSELRTIITGFASNDPIDQVAYQLGEDVLGRAFRIEPSDGPMHAAMLDKFAAEPGANTWLTPSLNVLKEAYGTRTLTELLGIHGDEYSDKLRVLLRNDNSIRAIRYLEQEQSGDLELADYREKSWLWMRKAVEAATGMEADEASSYVYSASRSTENRDIASVLDKFDHFGVGRIRALARGTGIHGLEAYTIEQLERMEGFMNNPDQLAETLKQHDVTVVLVNRFGDHNSVLINTASDFDDKSGRTLFFEISKMSDIYRHMTAVRKSGIRPSTLVLAAHSAPGQFMVTDERDRGARRRDVATVAGRNLVRIVNGGSEHLPGDYAYSMHSMHGMTRLVDEYMQPSRGIDDDRQDAGRKKIIFSACDMGTEVGVFDIDEKGEKAQIGMESVIGQLGKDLIATDIKTDVDIYGAPAGIQMHRTNRGVRYSGHSGQMGEERTPLHAERIRLEKGALSKQEVREIVLRKVIDTDSSSSE